MRVFGIGLGRTGTQSLASALRTLGFRVVHYPADLAEIDKHDACLDITVAKRFRFLDAIYPGSKFILTTREMESWLRSCQWHYSVPWREAAPGDIPLEQKMLAENDFDMYGTWRFDEEHFRHAKWRHESGVRFHFADRQDDLLTLDITTTPAEDLWRALVAFLDVPVVDFGQPFPWENRSEPVR